MKRREFLKNSIFIPAAGVTLFYTISSCSDDSTSATSGNTIGTQPVGTCTTTSISVDQHFHTVAQPDLTSIVDVTLSMTTGHTHSVTLTAADLENLSKCGTVTVTSTTNVHSHLVTFTGA